MEEYETGVAELPGACAKLTAQSMTAEQHNVNAFLVAFIFSSSFLYRLSILIFAFFATAILVPEWPKMRTQVYVV